MEKKKKIIMILTIILLLTLATIGLVVFNNIRDQKTTGSDNIKEEEKKEEKEPIENEKEEEQLEENPEENPQPEQQPTDPPTEENKTENQPSQEKPNTNGNSSSSGSNNTSSNNQSSGNSSSNSNPPSGNTSSGNSSSNNNTSDKEDTPEEPTVIETIIVNDKNINLSDYSSNIKITKGGTYILKGTFYYSVYIETNEKVTLNLDGVKIKSKADAAIANIKTNEFEINLVSGTTNTLVDNGSETDYDATLYSNGPITVNGTGTLKISGNRNGCEGIATKNEPITINSGNITIKSRDDGINTGGTGGTITINGGTLYIEADGDGIDSNKDIIFNGGTSFVVGGSKLINGSLDADQGYKINGGQLIALGSDQMITPITALQTTLCLNLTSQITKGTLVTLLDENDNIITSFEANDNFKNIIISTGNITSREFTIYTGGTNTGTKVNGVYNSGTYTKGTAINIKGRENFEIYSTVTTY